MHDRRLVNVCFHGVGVPARRLEPGEGAYWTSVDEFLRILDELVRWPLVRISFDDGNRSDVEVGLTALEERGLVATFFVLAGRFGVAGSLAEDDVQVLRSRGMTIGSHGMDHRSWRGLSPTTRDRELIVARQWIAEASGAPVDEVALPLGLYDRALLAHLRAQGYTAVHTSDRRAARAGAWLQPRFSVRSNDTAESLRAEVLTVPPPVRRVTQSVRGVLKRLR
ncbi:polysaccharide deacetylase family protein [Rhodococcus sp. NPDC003318]|uniref:polysaccharide deacetylase family protein n=1 Tax=Rhodococcus sp. NPDC003318 TaxID=3364503 RepID=UPI0036C2EDF8